jgi:hypothetical protein
VTSTYVAHFFGGVFLANALLHLVMGIRRRPFPTPFASPPFRGLSSAAVNIAWAVANLAVAWLLLTRLKPIDLSPWSRVALVATGFILMAFFIARSLRRLKRIGALSR